MSFVIRAALVIGVLSYLALNRDQPPGQAPAALASLPAVWEALPPELRERAIREGAAEAVRQIGGSATLPTSGDTLAASDRKPTWRGVEAR